MSSGQWWRRQQQQWQRMYGGPKQWGCWRNHRLLWQEKFKDTGSFVRSSKKTMLTFFSHVESYTSGIIETIQIGGFLFIPLLLLPLLLRLWFRELNRGKLSARGVSVPTASLHDHSWWMKYVFFIFIFIVLEKFDMIRQMRLDRSEGGGETAVRWEPTTHTNAYTHLHAQTNAQPSVWFIPQNKRKPKPNAEGWRNV